MAGSPTLLPESRLGATLRRDAWWVEILPVIILLGGFGIYATLRAFEGAYYAWGPYLSPFYSPLIDANHHWWPWSPALLILGGPLGFRATCYYYRKAYYRAFFLDPPSCAVGEPSKRKYKGETAFPFILQNVHRYFFYLAIVFLAFLWYDAVVAYDWNGHFGIGVGSLIMSVNIIMLTLYTFSCHSLRHLAGGQTRLLLVRLLWLNPVSPRGAASAFLNERHMLLAWTSLITVGFTDFYIRMVAAGVFHDLRLL